MPKDPDFSVLLLIRTRCPDTSSKATLWMKALHEGALATLFIVRKTLQDPHTALNMGSLTDVHRSQYLWQELLRKELYCKADQSRRQGIKSLFNPAAWVKSKGSWEFLTWKLIG